MSDPLKRFLDAVQDNNVDDTLLDTPVVQKTIKNLEHCGENLGEAVEEKFKHSRIKPAGPTPTYAESAFIKPKQETTLYNVTNLEKDVPVVQVVSKFFKKASYRVSGFTASADYKKEDNRYSLYAGEKVGLGWNKTQGQTDTSIKAQYNINNKKTNIEYIQCNPVNSYRVSIFNQNGNNGLSAGYSNSNGVNSAFSIDNNSASLSCGYNKNYDNCKLELSAYATTGDSYSNPFAGVSGRITF